MFTNFYESFPRQAFPQRSPYLANPCFSFVPRLSRRATDFGRFVTLNIIEKRCYFRKVATFFNIESKLAEASLREGAKRSLRLVKAKLDLIVH